MLRSKLELIKELNWKYLFRNNYIRCCKGGNADIAKTANITRSKIIILPGGHISIGNNSKITNMYIVVANGELIIGENALIGSKTPEMSAIDISQGRIVIDHHTKIDCKKLWARFGGELYIGPYTNVNRGSEIRCDEKVTIGSYNQISYNVRIWDTNTHNILPVEERRKLAHDYFPSLGKELERPKTGPVVIGNDCWIGENVAIMKGSRIGNEVIVGFGSIVLAKEIPDRSTVYNPKELNILKR